MTLDERERKLVEQLRSETRHWPHTRWCLLIPGGYAVYLGILSQEVVLWILGGGAMCYAIQYWRGRPTATLLLRLLEQEEAQ